MSGKIRRSRLFLFFLVLIFLRPLVSGSGLDYFGARAAMDTFLRLGALSVVLAAALGCENRSLRIPLPFALCLWLGWSLVASVMAEIKGGSFFVAFGRLDVYVAVAALAAASASLVRSKEEKELVIKVLMCSGLVASLYGFRQYFFGFEQTIDYVSAYGAGPIESAGHAADVLSRKRIFSTTFSPDIFAGLLAMLVPLSAAYLVDAARRRSKGRIFAAVVIAAELLAAYLSGSLGGWLACGFGLLVLTAVLAGGGGRWKAGAVIITTVVLIAAAGIVLRRAGAFTDIGHPHNPIVQRVNYWRGGLNVAAENPLTGVGPGHFGVAYLSVKPAGAGATRYAHNALVQYLSEDGIPGAIGFFWLAAGFLWCGFKTSRKDVLSAGIFAGGAAFLAHSMIDYDTEIIEVAGVFGAILGMSVESGRCAAVFRRKDFKSLSVAGFVVLVMLAKLWGAAGAYSMEMAGFHLGLGETEKALGYAKKAAIFRDSDPGLAKLEQKIHTARGDRESALKACGKQVGLFPRDPFAWMNLGKVLLAKGEYKKAMEAFQKAEALYPSFKVARGMVHYCKAHVFMEEGRLEDAGAELKAILEDFPGHEGALKGLEYIKKLEKGK